MSEELAEGIYVAARVGFESAPLQMQDIEFTTEPPRPTIIINVFQSRAIGITFVVWAEMVMSSELVKYNAVELVQEVFMNVSLEFFGQFIR